MIAQIVFLSTFLMIADAGQWGLGGLGGLESLHGGLSISGGKGIAIAPEPVVEYWAPPKYEFKYGVEDYHTGDVKQQDESRVHDLTQSNYVVAEKDRKIQVSRIIAGSVPVVSKGW